MGTLKKLKGAITFITILLLVGTAWVAFPIFLMMCPVVFVAWIIYMSTGHPNP